MAKVTDHTHNIINDKKQASSLFLRLFAEEVVRNSTPDTPKDTGALRRDVTKQILGLEGKIKWNKNYAAYQESKQFKNYTTPGTGPHFAENSIRRTVRGSTDIFRRAKVI